MSFSDWIRQFRALHAEARKGALSPEDLETYRGACEEFSRALMAAQRLTLKPGEAARHALRVARAIQVELESPVTLLKVTTIDFGVGGFSATLAKAPRVGEEFACKLKLPAGDPIETSVLVVEAKALPGSARATFSFKRLPDASKDRIEGLVIDTALAQIAA
jgi:hypothetical protein